MTEKDALEIAKPTVKAVVDCIADGLFEQILDHADFAEGISQESLVNAIEGFKNDARISHIDKYGASSQFTVNKSRLNAYAYNDGSEFSVDYDFTTDGGVNDLTLQMRFVLCESGLFKAIMEDCHVL